MKALVAPIQTFDHTWVTEWKREDNEWVAEMQSTIEGCQRIAEVAPEAFDVAPPLFWVDCPNECVADLWAYVNGHCLELPQSVPQPESPDETPTPVEIIP
jgi:hypothetical protein